MNFQLSSMKSSSSQPCESRSSCTFLFDFQAAIKEEVLSASQSKTRERMFFEDVFVAVAHRLRLSMDARNK